MMKRRSGPLVLWQVREGGEAGRGEEGRLMDDANMEGG